MTELRNRVGEIIRTKGYRFDGEGFVLASGRRSHHFVDGKRALADGHDLRTAGEALVELAGTLGVEWDAVGGLTNGADHLAHAVAMVAGKQWFFVRKEPKKRGTRQRLEGAYITAATRVLVVDDVITTGGSILDAVAAVVDETGAAVTGAITLVDRDDLARISFEQRGIPYAALLTYADLGIPPVHDEPESAGPAAG